jgi:NAD(P)-dependent dehydrogenase (short-subunit alcohol dehydrogenase family)
VVTGAGSGIGYAITRRLLEAGYAVSAWDVGMDIPSNEPTDRHSPPQVDLV